MGVGFLLFPLSEAKRRAVQWAILISLKGEENGTNLLEKKLDRQHLLEKRLAQQNLIEKRLI